jgi:hypothetical protein
VLGREGRGQDGEGLRHDQRGADAHHGTQGDEGGRVADHGGRGGGGAEHEQPDEQDLAPTEPVADRAERQEQGGERDRVRVDDPLQLGLVGVGVAGDVGQGDIQTADGRDDHHEREPDDDQDEAAVSGGHSSFSV